MDTDFLESFVAVVEGGSIAEAARRLNLTPAAVALRTRTLEKEFGVRLLIRSGRTVTPTEAGREMIELGRRLLRDVRDMKAALTVETYSGELRVGAVSTAITGLMPKILTTVQEVHPGMEIDVVPGSSTDLYAKVLSGELDGAIIVEPHFAMSKASGWAVLREEPLLVIAPASMAGSDAHSVLRSEPFIRYGRSLWGGRLVDNYLSRAGIRPKERFELATLDAIAVLVDQGLGVSLVPDWTPPWPEGLSLAKLKLPLRAEPRRLGLLWMKGSARVRLLRAFLEQAMASMPAAATERARSLRVSDQRRER
ncbi:LysR family transcriptional regulator [Bradyrhizobium sp. LHD-71]|uniref:LysR family transcriptional regulator n=1 Tax=Bradyrhizobium sp. LHD-71 TaxID=3072141 RepID=UPI00280E6C46|nr:LysR family transcriptional regulator [Bradyrhizobium sp. LHD-71]MDQ8729251.1 LysR family transcriptional regulator [Bradyrhizobium sp. LHD-71]